MKVRNPSRSVAMITQIDPLSTSVTIAETAAQGSFISSTEIPLGIFAGQHWRERPANGPKASPVRHLTDHLRPQRTSCSSASPQSDGRGLRLRCCLVEQVMNCWVLPHAAHGRLNATPALGIRDLSATPLFERVQAIPSAPLSGDSDNVRCNLAIRLDIVAHRPLMCWNEVLQ
jgi:hypothetical protein